MLIINNPCKDLRIKTMVMFISFFYLNFLDKHASLQGKDLELQLFITRERRYNNVIQVLLSFFQQNVQSLKFYFFIELI